MKNRTGGIQIVINGLTETVPKNMFISQLIIFYREGDTDLIVEHNGRFVYPKQYASTPLLTGDRVEFINPNFGG